MSDLYDLPNGWEWKQLSDLAKFQSGGTPSRSNKSYWDNGNINWVKISDITDDMYVSKTEEFITKDGLDNSSAKLFPKGTILYTIFATIGKIGILNIEATTNQAISGIQPKDNVDLFYMYYGLKFITNEVQKVSAGVAQNNINLTKLKEQWFPLPPLSEQQRIVSKLDNLFEKIDKSIALHQKNMDEADVFMGSVLNDVFGELEEKYGLTILSTVVKINSGIALPKIFKDKEFADGEFEFFKVAQMNNDKRVMKGADLNFTLSQSKEFKIKLFPKGSILIPKRGGAILTNKKRILEREASYDSNVMGLKADNEILSDEFLFTFLNSIDLANYIDTTTIPQVNNKHIDMMNISIPPLNIQQKVVKYLDEVSEKIEKIKSVQKVKMDSLKALKASILDRAFKGEL